MRMITLFGKEISKQSKGELEAEKKAEKWLHRLLSHQREKLIIEAQRKKPSWIRNNKIELLDIYCENLEGMIAEIDYYLPRSVYDDASKRYRRVHKKEYLERARLKSHDRDLRVNRKNAMKRDGISGLTWDREKFDLVAADRGYQTEEGVTYAISKQLKMDLAKTSLLLRLGRFTWGQVLVIGAMFRMTPKEFCDIFLAGYFADEYGEYRASFDNLDLSELVKRAAVPSKADVAIMEADTAEAD